MKTNLDSIFATSKDKEVNGVWFDIDDDTGFLLRRMGGENSKRIKGIMTKYTKPYLNLIKSNKLPYDKERSILVDVFVDGCLIDWKGVFIDEKEVDCSKENAKNLFNKLPELFDTLQDYTQGVESFSENLGN